MDRRILVIFTLLFAAAAPATAQTEGAAPEPVTLTLLGHQEGGAYFFTLEGSTQRNPDLVVPAGSEVTVTFTSVTGFHNLHVDGFAASDFVSDGDSTTYTFTAPASGSLEYWCDPHKSSGMKGRVVVQAASPGNDDTPAPSAPTEFHLLGHQEGGAFYFTLEGSTQRNPILEVPAGAEITITFTSEKGFHNVHVDGFPASAFVNDGETTTYTFTAPASGSLEYWCDPHKSSGMKGLVRVATAGGPSTGGPSTGGDCDIPAATEAGYVGGPTKDDYAAMCAGAGGSEVQAAADPYKAADYVIPATWALIGLGIAGVVWVHRSKP